MTSGRLEFKVGLFVIVLLGLAAVMSIRFSKTGFGLMDETVSINLHSQFLWIRLEFNLTIFNEKTST